MPPVYGYVVAAEVVKIKEHEIITTQEIIDNIFKNLVLIFFIIFTSDYSLSLRNKPKPKPVITKPITKTVSAGTEETFLKISTNQLTELLKKIPISEKNLNLPGEVFAVPNKHQHHQRLQKLLQQKRNYKKFYQRQNQYMNQYNYSHDDNIYYPYYQSDKQNLLNKKLQKIDILSR